MSGFLEIEGLNITLGRGGPRLLRDVSMTVERQKVMGLVGESGAGKSMIGKAIAGLLPRSVHVHSGAIRLDGQDLLAMRPAARRRLIGARTAIIPQDPQSALNPCRRIGGQITDRLIHTLGWDRARATARARDILDEVQIRDPERVLRSYPHELSGGMRQRILIAAAFAAEPELIIADEPTTALDVTVQKQILRLIHDLQHRHNTALLFVTHDMGVVAKICQDVSVLYAGKIMYRGSARALFSGEKSHPYADALIAATPRFDRPEDSLLAVPRDVIAALDAEIAADDATWGRTHAA